MAPLTLLNAQQVEADLPLLVARHIGMRSAVGQVPFRDPVRQVAPSAILQEAFVLPYRLL